MISDINIRYMKELVLKGTSSLPLQMNLKGPDLLKLPHTTWSNIITQKTFLKKVTLISFRERENQILRLNGISKNT